MSFFRSFSLKTSASDLVSFVRSADRDHVIGLTLALLVTGIIVILFTVDAKVNTSPGRTVQYVELFESDRTDEEIVARQQQEQREIEERARARQEEFQKIDDALERAGI